MSNIAMQGGATGTGTVTLLAPSTSTNRTLTLPDTTGTILTTATAGVPVNGPAFSAYRSTNQTVSANTTTKVAFNAEEFDTNNCFDSTTNYRFTPTVSGYYQVSGVAYTGTGAVYFFPAIYKNGSAYLGGQRYDASVGGNQYASIIGGLIYLNGSTDYIEMYIYTSGVVFTGGNTDTSCRFTAAMVRSAV